MSVSTRSTWPVIGHEWAVDHLARAINHGRMRHAYLITGPSRIGKTTLARVFAAALNCTGETVPCGTCRSCTLIAKDAHPDIITVEAETERGSLKIDQVRDLQQSLALRPYEARYRVAILRRFHEANPAAANALLKTLEEPAPNAVLLLTANSTDQLLPTIVSRCQPLHLRPLPLETVREALEWHWDAPQDIARKLARLSGGRMGWAIHALQDPSELEVRNAALDALYTALQGNRRIRFDLIQQLPQDKLTLLTYLDVWQGFWRDVLLLASGSRTAIMNVDHHEAIRDLAQLIELEAAQHALDATRRTINYLEKNANTRLTLEVLMLDYPAL